MSSSQKHRKNSKLFDLTDSALDELVLEEGELDLVVDHIVDTLQPASPPAAVRNRLMRSIAGPSRLLRFAAKIAEMADITIEAARGWLQRLDDTPLWEGGVLPGVETVWIEGGPAAACAIRGFVRIAPGHSFPPHRHLGHETTLVLEGEYHDSDGEAHGPGAVLVRDLDSEHAYSAGEGTTHLLMFNVVFEGIAIGDMVVRHRDDV